jgi:hypothetical protein
VNLSATIQISTNGTLQMLPRSNSANDSRVAATSGAHPGHSDRRGSSTSHVSLRSPSFTPSVAHGPLTGSRPRGRVPLPPPRCVPLTPYLRDRSTSPRPLTCAPSVAQSESIGPPCYTQLHSFSGREPGILHLPSLGRLLK